MMKRIIIQSLKNLRNKLAYTLLASLFFLIAANYTATTLTIGSTSQIGNTVLTGLIERIVVFFGIITTVLFLRTIKKKKGLNKKQVLAHLLALLTAIMALLFGLEIIHWFVSFFSGQYYGTTQMVNALIIALKGITITNMTFLLGLVVTPLFAAIIALLAYIISHSTHFMSFIVSEKTTSEVVGVGITILDSVLPNFDFLAYLTSPNITQNEILTIILSLFGYNVCIILVSMMIVYKRYQ